jgi:hypothetical protein
MQIIANGALRSIRCARRTPDDDFEPESVRNAMTICRWGSITLVWALAACDTAAHRAAQSDSARDKAAASTRPVDALHLLELGAAVNPSNVAERGTCLALDAERRSRLIYLLLPAESSYIRFAIVSHRGQVDMIDLVRGIPDGRIWTATFEGAGGPATERLFASASDKKPATKVWPVGDLRLNRLHEVASVAIETPCAQ